LETFKPLTPLHNEKLILPLVLGTMIFTSCEQKAEKAAAFDIEAAKKKLLPGTINSLRQSVQKIPLVLLIYMLLMRFEWDLMPLKSKGKQILSIISTVL